MMCINGLRSDVYARLRLLDTVFAVVWSCILKNMLVQCKMCILKETE